MSTPHIQIECYAIKQLEEQLGLILFISSLKTENYV